MIRHFWSASYYKYSQIDEPQISRVPSGTQQTAAEDRPAKES